MKALVIAFGAAMLAGCSTGNTSNFENGVIGGPTGDLRILMNGECDGAKQFVDADRTLGALSGGLLGLAESALINIGQLGVKSFGTYLKEAGEAETTRSYGVNGGMFYSVPSEDKKVTISPDMRCIYLVRGGFSPKGSGLEGASPATLNEKWTNLGLTQSPSLFAEFHIETSGEAAGPVEMSNATGSSGAVVDERVGGPLFDDEQEVPSTNQEGTAEQDRSFPGQRESFTGLGFDGPYRLRDAAIQPPFFRVVLDDLYVAEFQTPDKAARKRDIAFVFNYSLGLSQATIASAGTSPGTTTLDQAFAVGAIRLPGAEKGHYPKASLKALQTAWMPMPGTKEFDARATTDVGVYIAEYVPGNKMMQDIGAFLAGSEFDAKVKTTLTDLIDLDGSGREGDITARYTLLAKENELVAKLQDSRIALETLLDKSGTEFDARAAREKSREVETAILEIEQQRDLKGWIQTQKLDELTRSRPLLEDPRLRT